jgi:hypothetical protein
MYTVTLAGCGDWNNLPDLTFGNPADTVRSIVEIWVTRPPYPNTFYREELPEDNGWERQCGLEVSGINSVNEIRVLAPSEYTVGEWDDSYGKKKITVMLNGTSGYTSVMALFDIEVVPSDSEYREVLRAQEQNIVPYPSKAVAGQQVTVSVYNGGNGVYKEGSLVYVPASDPDSAVPVERDGSGVFCFTMPDETVTLGADFIDAAAKLETAGRPPQYYETLAEAFDAVAIGTNAAVTLLRDTAVDGESAIIVAGAVSLAAADGTVKTIRRGSNLTGGTFSESLFTVGMGASLSLGAGDSLGLALDGSGGGANAPLVTVSGGTLVMGGRVSLANNDGGAVRVSGGLFRMNGGTVSGNTAGYGGGVDVRGGTFTLAGGEISGNGAVMQGGGVYIRGSGSFAMSGGAVNDNSAAVGGGGVYVCDGSLFRMTGGTIDGNTSGSSGTGGDGGGVYVRDDSEFTVSGGAIHGNAALARGGGVYIHNSNLFKLFGGTISGNSAGTNGADVYLGPLGMFTLSGGGVADGEVYLAAGTKISVSGSLTPPEDGFSLKITTEETAENTVVAEGTAGYALSSDDISRLTLDGSQALLYSDNKAVLTSSGFLADISTARGTCESPAPVFISSENVTLKASIRITSHVKISAPQESSATRVIRRDSSFHGSLFVIEKDASLTLDKGIGPGLRLTGNSDATAPLIMVDGGTLVMGSGIFMVNNTNTSGNGGGVVITNNGTFTMNDGAIGHPLYGGNTATDGGGVYIDSGTFTMNGGTISNNTASRSSPTDGNGGGVGVGSGTFTMNGGTINGNTAHNGGGVKINNGTFEMNAGTISGNNANAGSGGGGGLSIDSGTFTMNNGTISGNTAAAGSGVEISGGRFTMSNGTISGNTANLFGGGVYVRGDGTSFIMDGGEISGNHSTGNSNGAGGGGGVYVQGSGSFTMAGGKIRGNDSKRSGGGVYVMDSTFTMEGGEISSNTVVGGDSGTRTGGGVFSWNSTFTMTGGKISLNVATDQGGGVSLNGGTFKWIGGTIYGEDADSSLANTGSSMGAFYNYDGTSNVAQSNNTIGGL